MNDLLVGTAGHIDHGKTSLVRALTGMETDRLQEEKRRGITIDIGFAHMTLGDYRIGFIDVPGHEKFVKNMLAGIGGVNLLLLVVSADESVMPQTIEHFEICRLLGIPRGLVAITKKSQADDDMLMVVKEEVEDLLAGSFMEGAPMVAVDSISGEGIDNLVSLLCAQVRQMDKSNLLPSPDRRVFRMPIDRVFSIKGFGTVVTGTPLSGSLAREDPVAAYPSGITGKVRGIEVFNEPENWARAGQRTALNLSGVNKRDLSRGMFLAIPGSARTTRMLDVSLRMLESAPGPLKQRSPIRLHHGSGEWLGRVYLLGSNELDPGHRCLAQIRLDQPILCFPGDPFILRRYSPMTTIGGGVVLHNAPGKHHRKELESTVTMLERLESALVTGSLEGLREHLELLVKEAGPRGTRIAELVFSTGFTENVINEQLNQIPSVVMVSRDPPLAVIHGELAKLKRQILQFLECFHRDKPLSSGISREELKERFLSGESSPCFQYLLKQLEKEELIEVRQSLVALFGCTARLTSEQIQVKEGVLKLIEDARFQPPRLDELIKKLPYHPDETKKVYYYLLERGELFRLSEGVAVLPSHVELVTRRLRERFPPGMAFSVPEFKRLLSISRKYAIPLLEFLDRQKVTRRVGDKRMVVKAGASHDLQPSPDGRALASGGLESCEQMKR